jgi:hypothetical protein
MRTIAPIAKLTLICSLVITLFGVVQPTRAATTWIVRNLNDDGKNSLRQLIRAAQSGDTIQFDPVLSGTLTLQSTINIEKSLTIIGTGSREIRLQSSQYGALFAIFRQPNIQVKFQNLEFFNPSTIRPNHAIVADNSSSFMFNRGKLSLDAVNFEGNIILYAVNFQVSVSHSKFQNYRGYWGADYILEVKNDFSSLSVTDSEFINNQAMAVYLHAPDTPGENVIQNSVFRNNEVGIGGPSAAGLSIEKSQFLNNEVAIGTGYAAVYDSTFDSNSLAVSGYGLEVYRSTFKNIVQNPDFETVGFIRVGSQGDIPGVYLKVANSTFYQNSSGTQLARAITICNGTADIANSTFYINASNLDQTLSICWNSPTITLRNTILFREGTTGLNCIPQVVDVGNNIQYGGASASCPGTIPVLDPKLAPLARNGGLTETMALQPGSPAIDAGNPMGCKTGDGTPITTDQRGFFRPINGRCDIGAFEVGSSAYFTPTITPTPTATYTPSITLSPTPSHQPITATPSNTPTRTNTPSNTPTPLPGQRTDTIGLYKDGLWHLRNSNTTGGADIVTAFGGAPEDLPVVGDWNGDGVDSLGVYRNGLFLLTNANTSPAVVNYQGTFGNPGDRPFSGKWDNTMSGDGIGVHSPSNGLVYLSRRPTGGFPDYEMSFGEPGDLGFSGDWDGNGFTSIGVYRPVSGRWLLTNNGNGSGITPVDVDFTFLVADALPFTGNWLNDGKSRAGLYQDGTVSLRYTLTTGNADFTFNYGMAGGLPVAGRWVNPSNPSLRSVVVQPGGGSNPDSPESGD